MDVGECQGGIAAGVVADPTGGEVCEAGTVYGAGYGEDVLDVAGVAAGHLDHGGEVGLDLSPAGAGEEGDPGLVGVEVVVGGVGLAGDGGEGKFGEGVAYELGLNFAVFVELLFEGKDGEHAGDALLDPAEAASLPGPELGGDEPDDGYSEGFEVLGEAKVDVGEVNEDGCGGWVAANAGDQLAVLGVDVGGVEDDLRDAHVSYVFGFDDAGLAGLGHLCAAEAGEGGVGE